MRDRLDTFSRLSANVRRWSRAVTPRPGRVLPSSSANLVELFSASSTIF